MTDDEILAKAAEIKTRRNQEDLIRKQEEEAIKKAALTAKLRDEIEKLRARGNYPTVIEEWVDDTYIEDRRFYRLQEFDEWLDELFQRVFGSDYALELLNPRIRLTVEFI